MKEQKRILFIILYLIMALVLVGCDFNIEENELKSIDLISTGKDEYYIGEEFDFTGYQVQISYSIDKPVFMDVTKEMCDDIILDTVGTKNIKITYSENNVSVSTYFEIIVKDKEEKPIENDPIETVVLQSIELQSKGNDIYCCNIEFDLTGYVFVAKYSDGTSKNINITLDNLDHITFENPEKEIIDIITVTYQENDIIVRTTFEVTVMNEWDYDDYIEEKEMNDLLNKAINDCNLIITDEILENLDLPDIEDYNYKFKVIWTSSNEKVLSSSGTVNRQEEDEHITLNVVFAEIGSNNVLEELTYDVLVPGLGPIEFEDLTNKKVSIGYFYEGTYAPLKPSDGNKIDILVYSFGRMNEGKVSIGSLTHINQVMAWRREYKMRIILAIGGGGSEGTTAGFSQAVATEESRRIFIDSIMNIIKEYNFDGIDMDWEYPGWDGLTDSTSQDVHNFTLFLKELRKEFDEYKEGLIITAAVVGTESINKFYEATEVAKYVDYLNVMTYDCNYSAKTSHHTAPKDTIWSTESAIINWLAKGVDSKKIVIGAAFYGKMFTLSTPVSNPKDSLGKAASSVKTIQYTEIYNSYINNPDFNEYLDTAAEAYYLSDGKIFISYDNPYSIQVKADMVKEYDLGGIMFWDFGSDTTGQLLQAVYNGLNKINKENNHE